MSDVRVKGLAELQRFLDQLPAKLEANVMRGALRAGVQPIKAAAVSACPVGPPSASGAKKYGLYAGALRDSIRISSRRKLGQVSAAVKVGGKRKGVNVWYAHLVEFTGARQHAIKGRLFGSLFIGGAFVNAVDHPGMRPRPFLRPALDAQAQSAVVAAGEYIKTRLATREGLDTADIVIEEEEA